MIWATVSSQSYFCWLYRACPSLVAKNIISLILVLAIWWCPCVESSLCCWKKLFVMTSAFSWQNFCQPLPCFILYCKAKFACYSRCFLTSYFCIHTVEQNLLPQSPCKCIEYFIESKKQNGFKCIGCLPSWMTESWGSPQLTKHHKRVLYHYSRKRSEFKIKGMFLLNAHDFHIIINFPF